MDPKRSHEELIDNYLSETYRPGNDEQEDQQFAKPIEDEDVFGDLTAESGPSSTHSQSLKRKRWETLKEICKKPAPRRFAADCDEDGMVLMGDIEVVVKSAEPKPAAQDLFRKAGLRRVKDQFGLYKGQKLVWQRYNDYLHKRISSDKRAKWDSFHNKSDNFNDEEELVDDEEELVDDEIEEAEADQQEANDCDDEEEAASYYDHEAVSDHDLVEPESEQEESESDLDCGAANFFLDEADSDGQSDDDNQAEPDGVNPMNDPDDKIDVQLGEEDEVL